MCEVILNMQLSRREQVLADILLQKSDYVTAEEIANLAGISTKTVYRIIKKVNDSSSCGEIIESSRGRGYKINYENYMKEKRFKIREFLDYTPIERRNSIILNLLFKSPYSIRLERLYEKYYVSKSAIENDLNIISNTLKKYGIKMVHKGKSISIIGSEIDIRRAINTTILKMNLFDAENLYDFSSDRHTLNQYDKDFIISQIEEIERSLNMTIPYPYNINIFTHLYILINRFREGKFIENKEGSVHKEQQEIIKENPHLYAIAKKVITDTSHYLNAKLSSLESIYLLQYLVSTRFNQDRNLTDELPSLVKRVTKFYITKFNEIEHQNIRYELVKNDLANHIKPMLNRIYNHIYIKNNLLDEIKLEYGHLFNSVEQISKKVEEYFQIGKISEDESGFITLYFAKYIEQEQKLKRVLIMCTSGVGTSELLKVKVQKAFPELEIVDVISTIKYLHNEHQYSDVDLIITTVDLNIHIETPVLLVSAMFTNKDKNRLAEFLGGIEHG